MTPSLLLWTNVNADACRPGQLLEVYCGWQLDEPIEAIELRLFWYTQGKGTRDMEIVQTRRIESPIVPAGEEHVEFPLPAEPWSFSGRLITLSWAVEAVSIPGNLDARLDLIISPTRREMRLLTPID